MRIISPNILQILTPVGMYFVTSLSVPFFGSFGADQCASSEGFLVTLTPGFEDSEDSSLSLNFSSGHLCSPGMCFITSPSYFDRLRSSLRRGGKAESCSPEKGVQHTAEPLRGKTSEIVGGFGKRLNTSPSRRREDLEGFIDRDVMNPGPRTPGILVALNPTDEGRIGTGRNPRKWTVSVTYYSPGERLEVFG